MTAQIYLRADKDELVVDVSGANPNSTQTAQGALWSGRSPQARRPVAIGTLAETWTDNATGGTGQHLRHPARGHGRRPQRQLLGRERPHRQGRLQAPCERHFPRRRRRAALDRRQRAGTAARLLGSDATASSTALQAAHLTWWHNFWAGADLIEMSSADGSGAVPGKPAHHLPLPGGRAEPRHVSRARRRASPTCSRSARTPRTGCRRLLVLEPAHAARRQPQLRRVRVEHAASSTCTRRT